MSEVLILEKLDALSGELRDMKAELIREMRAEIREEVLGEVRAEVLAELRRDMALTDARGTASEPEVSPTQLRSVCQSLLAALEDLRGASTLVKAGEELACDLGPVVRQAYPHIILFLSELEGDISLDSMVAVLRKFLISLDSIGEGLDMLRAGIELRDDMMPIIQLAYPKMIRFLSSLEEGDFRIERVGDLLYTVLMNIQALTDLLNMVRPATELVKEVGVLLQHTDLLTNMNRWLHSLQTNSPLLRVASTVSLTAKRLDFTEERIAHLCTAIEQVDFSKSSSLGAFGLIGKMRDPEVQRALGFLLTLLQTMGTCLEAWDSPKTAEAQIKQ